MVGEVVSGALRDANFASSYSTSQESLLRDFYIPALSHASRYDRATGYFASSILSLAPLAFSGFVERGGTIRLLCSPHLSVEDARAIAQLPSAGNVSPREAATNALLQMQAGSRLENLAARCLSALISAGVVQLQFVIPEYGAGIFHDKTGIFFDDLGDRVAFVGSANETASAWSGFANHEQIEVYRSWLPEDAARAAHQAEQFEEMWFGYRRGLRLVDAHEAGSIVVAAVPSEPVAQILRDLANEVVKAEAGAPQLRGYQDSVLADWERHGRRGVIAFATGGGKTLTAVEAIRRWTLDGRPALVLVPSELLHKQWHQELSRWLPDAIILDAGAGHSFQHWAPQLGDYTAPDEELGQRVVLATYQTARTERFLSRLIDGDHLLVVGDEVHVAGAPELRSMLSAVTAGATLGLSATPERYGDATGTAAIFKFFGDVLSPRFDIADALRENVLVPYEYSLETCSLTEDEQQEWERWTQRISQELARNDGELTDRARLYLIQRARVLKRAHAKGGIAAQILRDEYREGDRWLVYCSDSEHLADVKRTVQAAGFSPLEYHSGDPGAHAPTLDYFETRGGILLAIKCLDEGVDIPLINKAIVLASSANPREYVQRRGRVLRRSPGKYTAHLFDVLVLDDDGAPLSPAEIERAGEFAEHALNSGVEVQIEALSLALGREQRWHTEIDHEETEDY